MQLPLMRKQVIEENTHKYYYNRAQQKIEQLRVNVNSYNEIFSPDRILYLYNLNAIQNTIDYQYTFNDKLTICSQIIQHRSDINKLKKLVKETENKYIREVA